MTLRLRAAVIATMLVTAVPLCAQPQFGQPFPLTDTRSGTSRGQQPLLTNDGRTPVLFWTDGRFVRMSRQEDGSYSPGRAILELNFNEGAFDAVWTGRHFVVVAAGSGGLVSRRVTSSGEPLGPPVVVTEGRRPRLAFNGSRILLLFLGGGTIELSALLLTADGLAAEAGPRPLGIDSPAVVAVASNGSSFAAVIPRPLEPLIVRFDESGAVVSTSVAGTYGSSGAIATDGSRYLAVLACAQGGPCSPSYVRLIAGDGTIDPPLELDPPFPMQPSVAWNGSEWLVSHTRDVTQPPALHVLHLDPAVSVVLQREIRDAASGALTSVGGKGFVARVNQRYFDAIHVSELPMGSAPDVAATFAPRRQLPPVTASGDDGTLVAWQEMGDGVTTLYTGVRSRSGEWEQRAVRSWLPRECFYCYEESINVLVASNGSSFLMLWSDEYGVRLDRLDAAGAATGQPLRLPSPFFVADILWSGEDYLLVGSESVLRLDDANVFHPVALPQAIGQDDVFASDGNGHTIAAWVDYHISEFGSVPVRLSIMRLDEELQPIDASPLVIAGAAEVPWAHSVAWDGEKFVIAWSGASGVMATRVAPSGDPSLQTVRVGGGEVEQTSVARVTGGSLVQWSGYEGGNQLALLRHDGTVSPAMTVSPQREHGRLVTLPTGDAAYLELQTVHGPPFESTVRIMTRVSGAAAAVPDAPELAVTRTGDGAELSWSSSGPPVDGYRIEMRSGSGPWVELEETAGPDQHGVTIPLDRANSFRIRAWNEAGLGGYSEVAAVSRRSRMRR